MSEMPLKDRNIYISNIPVDEALATYKSALNPKVHVEILPIDSVLFRITSKAVFAVQSSPNFHCAAMDGIAVVAEATYGASEKTPKILKYGVDFTYINTGNPMPFEYDAVIMVEDIVELEHGDVEIIMPAHPWQHIRMVGEDIVQGEMIIPSNHKIRPIDLGALLCGGVTEVEVYSKVKVGILPTGTEIVQKVDELTVGKIIDSNSRVFEGIVLESDGIPKVYPPAIDDKAILKAAILKGVEENDMLLINAGSSAGSKDFTADLIRELGEVVIHGVALKPGKPTILGIIKGKSVIGIPGYPVSAYFAFETFVKPMIQCHGPLQQGSDFMEATLAQRVVSSLKHQELVRVTLGEVEGRLIATPLNRGAGATMSLVRADGVLTIPRMSEGLEAGTKVKIVLIKTEAQILNRLLFIGSHDLILDILADRMPMTSGHVGSLGGIMSMKRGECHISPIHLIDESTGIYNIAYVKKYFEADTMSIIRGVRRLQGLMVAKGNPKKIEAFTDLTKDHVVYVNRQRGSGTRQLLDYELKKQGINSDDILGYNREMTTHMTVAVAVQSKAADAGLGIYACAKAMGLDFIPVGYESYDFLIPNKFLEDPRVIRFIDLLQSTQFKDQLEAIGGYELDEPGLITKVGK